MPSDGGFGFALWISQPILGIIVVHSGLTQNRRFKNGEENEAGPEAMPELRSLG
jgi:hypothetical protein